MSEAAAASIGASPTAAPNRAPDAYPWHGILFRDQKLPPPTCVLSTKELARPKFTNIDASEYIDSAAVLNTKVAALVSLLERSKCTLVYAGAGLSTASGIPDYASRAESDKSIVQPKSKVNFRKAEPTLAHRAIAALERRGLVAHFLQQNHDGLAQKAGFPFDKLNEIHGSWWDRSNPVVAMSGTLRSDLYEWMVRWSSRPELVLAVGTSFSGLSADSVAESCATRFSQGTGLGLVIVSIQRTPLDGVATLRFFSKIDDVMGAVVNKMGLALDRANYPPTRPPFWRVPKDVTPEEEEAKTKKRSKSVGAATRK